MWLTLSCSALAQSPATSFRRLNATEVKMPDAGSRDLAAIQASSWKLYTEAEPAFAPAWLNYYIWTERDTQAGLGEKKAALSRIAGEAGIHIRDEAEYQLIRFLESGQRDSVALHSALERATDKQTVYPYAIRFAVATGAQRQLKEWTKAFSGLSPIDPYDYAYHHNVLMSADSHATVYAAGLHDLVPLAVMQHVYGIRTDIRLACYDSLVMPNAGEYLCVSLGADILAKFPAASFTGLLVRMGASASTGELRRHFEKDFDLQFLHNGTYQGASAARLYKNYLPGLILLYKQYIQENNEKATGIRSIITTVAFKAGVSAEINKLIE
jgi:hypothetical protein